ncbi:MAG: acyl-CoA thioesterase, partial [Planctomycetaceae bacterium]|nr:acyl-CoA thioesterase [Planctomycetaceae bacterium]
MPKTFHYRRFVEFSDTDMAGIVHFSQFFNYMESAEHALLRSLGLSVFHTLEDGRKVSFPRVAASCEYESPAWCEDELDIAVSILRLGSKSITCRFDLTRAEKPIASGQVTCVCCLIEEGQPPR